MGCQNLCRFGLILILSAFWSVAHAVDQTLIAEMLQRKQIPVHEIKQFGEPVLPVLADLYEGTDDVLARANIAWVFYQLGWASEDAERVLSQDLATQNGVLRLQVQWAIAKVTQSEEVIVNMIDIMHNDSNARFRDKAACALASDFVHINPQQRLTLLAGLVEGLRSENRQVQHISLQALQIQTGQSKGFAVNASESDKQQAIDVWQQWLVEFERNP